MLTAIEKEQSIQEIDKFMEELCDCLNGPSGAGWIVEERKVDWCSSLHHIETEASMLIHYASHTNRYEITGQWLKTEGYGEHSPLGYNEQRPSITCTRKKTPSQVAKDIMGRFMPVYFPLHEKSRKLRQGHIEYMGAKTNSVHQITEAIKKAGRTCKANTNGEIRVGDFATNSFGSVKISSDSANMDISNVPIDLMAKICELIAKEDV